MLELGWSAGGELAAGRALRLERSLVVSVDDALVRASRFMGVAWAEVRIGKENAMRKAERVSFPSF